MTPLIGDAILIDHQKINECYKNYKQAITSDDRKKWLHQLIWEIARHSIAEEIVVYPEMEKRLPAGKELAEKSRQEHLQVKNLLYSIDSQSSRDTEIVGLVDELMTVLGTHIMDEEQRDIPNLIAQLTITEQEHLGKTFERTKKFAPTRPHPSAPDKPPFETAVGLLSAPIDKLMDLFRSFPDEHEMPSAKA